MYKLPGPLQFSFEAREIVPINPGVKFKLRADIRIGKIDLYSVPNEFVETVKAAACGVVAVATGLNVGDVYVISLNRERIVEIATRKPPLNTIPVLR